MHRKDLNTSCETHTTTSNGSLDEGIELLVSSNSELQVTGGDTLDLKILGSVTGQLENFGSQVLHNGSGVDGSGGSDTSVGVGTLLKETVNTTDGELETSTLRSGEGLLVIRDLGGGDLLGSTLVGTFGHDSVMGENM
jgi:hypothetical protein